MEIVPEDEVLIQMIEDHNNKLYNDFISIFAESLRTSDNVCMLFDVILYDFFKEELKKDSSKVCINDYEFFHLFKGVMHKFYAMISEQASKLEDDVVF